MISTALIGGLGITSSFAQVAEPTTAERTDATSEAFGEPETIVVTGSRIRSANIQSVSPVMQVSSEELNSRGVIRIEDMLNALPQVFAAQGANTSNEATGTAQVDLRGLRPKRTLVLVNGRRLPYGSPKNIPTDINLIPTALIDNVEVLTGGASAVYGSDAIAGVVNFKLIDDFEGFRFTSNLSVFQHSNDNDGLQNLLGEYNAMVPGAYLQPDDSVWNGFAQDYSVVVGTNVEDGRGNVTAYASFRKVDPVLQKDFDYSSCALGSAGPNGEEYSCSGSGTNAPANFTNAGRIPGLPTSFRATDDGTFVDGRATYNYAPYNYYQRPDERYTLGAFAHYEINEHFTPYMETMFMDDRSVAQIAPGTNSAGITINSAGITGINCDNPLLSAQQAEFLCTSNGLSTESIYDAAGNYIGPVDVAEGVRIARRNVEGGNRQDDLRHTTYRIVLGTRGKLVGPFNYDLYGSYANVGYRSRFTGDANRGRTALAFNAVRDQRVGSGTFGDIVCAVNADANPDNDAADCAPLDYFGPRASQEAVNYIAEFKSITGDTSLTNVVFAIDGDLGDQGFRSPWAVGGVGVALGVEYRKNSIDYLPDEIYQAAASPELPISGETVAKEVFGEILVPIVEDRPYMETLAFEGAYRYSDYNSGFTTDTYKLGFSWAPDNDLRFRGSFQRAIRAPNVIELFSGQSMFEVELTRNADGSFDPCAGANPFASFEQCSNTGVTAAQYGFIVDNPAGQFGALIGGNPNLQPETANTYSIGAVFQPSFADGLSLSVDYFDIEVEDLIGSVNPNLSLGNCLNTGDPFFCGLVQRSPSGSLFQGENGFFRRFNVNTGSLMTSGIDLSVNYQTDLAVIGADDLGFFNFNLVGTYLDSFETIPLPNSPESDIYECSGLFGGLCGRPRPEWRHKFFTTWETPWDLQLALTWRYTSPVKVSQTSSQPALEGSFAEVDRELGSRSYFDLSLAYVIRDDFNFRFGISNVFDKDPPLTTISAIEDGGNGNTYPQYYDATGRFFFLSGTIGF